MKFHLYDLNPVSTVGRNPFEITVCFLGRDYGFGGKGLCEDVEKYYFLTFKLILTQKILASKAVFWYNSLVICTMKLPYH